jgi:hypothetical protein
MTILWCQDTSEQVKKNLYRLLTTGDWMRWGVEGDDCSTMTMNMAFPYDKRPWTGNFWWWLLPVFFTTCAFKDYAPGDAMHKKAGKDAPERPWAKVRTDTEGPEDGDKFKTLTLKTLEYFALCVPHMVMSTVSPEQFKGYEAYIALVKSFRTNMAFQREFEDKWDNPSKRFQTVSMPAA